MTHRSQLRTYLNWRPVASLIALIIIALGLLAQAPTTGSVTPLASPASPAGLVRVIVQRQAHAAGLDDLVSQLGGRITDEFAIINAFAAELPGPAIARLEQAPGVRSVSLDTPLKSAVCTSCIDTTNLVSSYIKSIRADQVWNEAPYRHGEGIGVAVIDTGIDGNVIDLQSRLVAGVQILAHRIVTRHSDLTRIMIFSDSTDPNGHGTHVAGIIGGDGRGSQGRFIGAAPRVNLLSLRVTDDQGLATTGNVIHALEWILNNQNAHNIRVVNISLNSADAETAETSPLNAAVETLWFNGIVVVVSAGNNGNSTLYPPANDPFVITVGAADDKGTPALSDDAITSFSAYGTTSGGVTKPDLVAPGRNIVSTLSTTTGWASAHPKRVLRAGRYFRLSGTSMSAPMVAGAVAMLLQDEPNLTPDQVKYRLMATANKSWSGYDPARAGAGYLDVYAAVNGSTTESANTGQEVNQLLWTGDSAPNWGSVNWGSVNWGSVNWGSVNWGSVNWGSDYWGN